MPEHPLQPGTAVAFDIAEGLNVGRGTVLAAKYDDGWLYRIDGTDGDPADRHRNERGELWVLNSEVLSEEVHDERSRVD